MKTFVTADYHLGHTTIGKLAKRPEEDVTKMSFRIVQNHNNVVTKGDVVYHIGDFAFKSGKLGVKISGDTWENMLNGKVIHILGNHDYKNNIRGLSRAFIKFSNKNIMMQHVPPTFVPDNVDIVLCGHVHGAWKYKMINGKPVINVGIDVWNYKPVTLDKVIRFIEKEKLIERA